MEMNKKEFAIICAVTVLGTLGASIYKSYNKIEPETRMEPGYVTPSNLEIKLIDINGNEKLETVLRYQGHSYLLKVDAAGKPVIQDMSTAGYNQK